VGKLVRDRIPDIMRCRGVEPNTRVLGESEYWSALLDKLGEESQELRDAPPGSRLEEAADVFEVISAVATAIGHSIDDVIEVAREKRSQRGAFQERVWLESW
jgi:predicted house-cleaning noncanonical NTP pyrophosphatase (MazG superfamily)